MRRVIKLVAFNIAFMLGISALIYLSRRGIGLDFSLGAGPVKFAFSVTFSFWIVILFVGVNFRILMKDDMLTFKMEELTNTEKCIYALKKCRRTDPAFLKEIERTIEQLKLLERRKVALKTLLKQNDLEETFSYLNDTAERANYYVFANVKSVINKLIVFDNEEYKNHPENYDFEKYHDDIYRIVRDNDLILKEYLAMLNALSNISDVEKCHNEELSDVTKALNDVLKGEHFELLEQEYNKDMEE